jgi:Cu/Ag efflux protein CusF
MKTLPASLVALAAVTSLAGAGFAQTSAPATPPAAATPAPALKAPAKAPALKHITGEVVSFDKTARTATVKYTVDQKPTEITLSVSQALLSRLKTGEHVKVGYQDVGGKLVAKTITRA